MWIYDDNIIVVKDDEVIVHTSKFILSNQVFEGSVKYIIILYIHVTYKKGNTVTIHTTSNRSKYNE